jgi:putative membrane protein
MNSTASRPTRFVSLGLAATLSLLALGGVQQARAEEKGNRGQLSAGDYKFVTDATHGGMMEVTLGQMAAQKATDPAVRDFGKRMVQDHQKADQQLMQLVSQKGATLPTDTTGEHKGMVGHLKNLSGADFDKAYMSHMVTDHKKDVKEFQNEAKKAQDPDVRAFASQTLPVLEEHLHLAQTVQSTVTGERRQSKAE